MPDLLPKFRVLRSLTPDGQLLFATRSVRLFAYGFLSVILFLYLVRLGLSDARTGLLLTLTLVGDVVISLWLTTTADRLGRRRALMIGAVLMIFAGFIFAATSNFFLLLIAATIGVISPSGGEVGPFLSVEQAALSQTVSGNGRTAVFAWFNLAGSLATALGALCGGLFTQGLQRSGISDLSSYRLAVVGYAALGAVLALIFTRLSPAAEAPKPDDTRPLAQEFATRFGLHRSRGIVLKMSALFALDAFGGGFVVQSVVAYWFHVRFGIREAALGGIFFGANVLAGVSALTASWIASRIGLINTMVFTHLPSNILLILVPLMPNLPLAVAVLFLRFSISQMDVPTRQSYTMAVVDADERSAAAGVTAVARTAGASLSPMLAGLLVGIPALASLLFFLAGGMKIAYDLLLYRGFTHVKPPEERTSQVAKGSLPT